MKVKVNKDVCIGCGACQAIAEKVFEVGDEGTAEVISDNIGSDIEEDVKEAIESCPTGAISEE